MDRLVSVSQLNGAVVDGALRGDVVHVRRYHKPVAVLVRHPQSRAEAEALAAMLLRLVPRGDGYGRGGAGRGERA